MPKGYKHLTYNDRLRIEVLLKAGVAKTEIAKIMGVHCSTIYREVKRGVYEHLNTDWTQEMKYSPDISWQKHVIAGTHKGPARKFKDDVAWMKYMESRILEYKESPAVALINIERLGLEFDTKVCLNTVYNYIRQGFFEQLTMGTLPYKKRPNKQKKKHVQKRASRGDSIEKRPKAVEDRDEFGHWEMDTVVGPQGKSHKVLLVLTERKTRQEIIEPLEHKTAAEVVRALDRIERSFTEKRFRQVFRTITVDNGSEFHDFEGMERSRRNKKNRTKVYYCHPYASSERGSNENQNRLIRRHIPKGVNFDDVPRCEIKQIERWMNDYPRKIFNYHVPEEIFQEEFRRVAM